MGRSRLSCLVFCAENQHAYRIPPSTRSWRIHTGRIAAFFLCQLPLGLSVNAASWISWLTWQLTPPMCLLKPKSSYPLTYITQLQGSPTYLSPTQSWLCLCRYCKYRWQSGPGRTASIPSVSSRCSWDSRYRKWLFVFLLQVGDLGKSLCF